MSSGATARPTGFRWRIWFWKPLLVAAFLAFLTLWTVALLSPVPPEAKEQLGGEWQAFLFGKCLHIGSYAFLTVLAGLLPLPRRGRWLVLALLVLHAVTTETIQPYFGRGGSIKDVGIDSVGMALGLLVGWRWWRAGEARSPLARG